MEDGGIKMGGFKITTTARSLIPSRCPYYFSWCILGLGDALNAIEFLGVFVESLRCARRVPAACLLSPCGVPIESLRLAHRSILFFTTFDSSGTTADC
jgi:hypothetical protein